ncbi:hypothetical protein GCM10009841_01480 [Microlunatus panaciterrae]|uniref:YbaB/EbfC DNA-binding family protein n=1 Tax=Microlunatus panaciterrae TaxID=400768 RepID=A0ABS2RJP9_9ACTN|nr:DUF6191 domain-containing protein [Microlunatus panaciterrae]MBM7799230.1 hypothetical protein [Microlunatus panaciterrae]
MTSFFEIFQPGLQHLREERDRQRMLVSKPTHGGGAPLGIDLDGGVAKITLPARRADEAATTDLVAEADTAAMRSAGDSHPAPPTQDGAEPA